MAAATTVTTQPHILEVALENLLIILQEGNEPSL